MSRLFHGIIYSARVVDVENAFSKYVILQNLHFTFDFSIHNWRRYKEPSNPDFRLLRLWGNGLGPAESMVSRKFSGAQDLIWFIWTADFGNLHGQKPCLKSWPRVQPLFNSLALKYVWANSKGSTMSSFSCNSLFDGIFRQITQIWNFLSIFQLLLLFSSIKTMAAAPPAAATCKFFFW